LPTHQTLKNKAFLQSQARSKSHGQGKLSAHGTTKPLGNQTSKPLVIPYRVKEGSKARKEEEAKEHGQRLKSIHLS
jgi:hypothetical protein